MNGHSMAWAVELHEKLGLNDKQVARLKEAYGDLRAEGEMLNKERTQVDRALAELRENYLDENPKIRSLEDTAKEIGARRERLQARASEIVADTLNKEQLAVLRKTMAERNTSDG